MAHKVIPKYARINIKTSNHSKAAKQTEKQTRILRVTSEIKFLYKKKIQLNKSLYTLHIENANIWGNSWHIISQNIDNALENIMKQKYNNINNKLSKLKEDNNTNPHQQEHTFYQRVHNLSKVTFTKDEMSLLNKGLKYNLHHKQKQWIQTLAIEADSAINLLNPYEQAHMRQAVSQKLHRLINKEKTQIEKRTNHKTRQESIEKKIITNLKKKIKEHNLIVTKADKGNTLVIIEQNEYHQKIKDFITQNNFTKVPNNHTNKQQKAIKAAINECKITIKQTEKWKYTNMNPIAPRIHGTIKLHKENKPIRPIVDWKNSPGYKLAIHLVKLLKQTIQLPNVFNVHSSETLIHNLKQTNVQTSTKICSFDIKNIYTNIPQKELVNIIYNTLTHNNIPTPQKKETITLVKTILNQNYLQHNNELYNPSRNIPPIFRTQQHHPNPSETPHTGLLQICR
jgi:hypothetical protein